MGSNDKIKIEQILAEEYDQFAPQLDRFQWPWETARWHELVFCILCQIDDTPEACAVARATVDLFVKLDLLNVEALTKCVTDDNKPDFQSSPLPLMTSIMERQGYSKDEQIRGIGAVCQVATSLQKRFGGKVQLYLRKYGDQMLLELSENFDLDQLSGEETKRALTHWFQNVLNMPLAFSNSQVEEVCREAGVEVPILVDIADRNDINLAMVDDWATDYMTRREKMAVIKPKLSAKQPGQAETKPKSPTVQSHQKASMPML